MSDGLWRVQSTTGEIRRYTLDELDAAYHAGRIGDDTFVLRPGATVWPSPLPSAAPPAAASSPATPPSTANAAPAKAGAHANKNSNANKKKGGGHHARGGSGKGPKLDVVL